MKKIKKRIKWPRTRLERFHQYGDMGSTERLRFSQTLGDSRGRLASVASVQSIDHDDLSLAASAHGFYARTKPTSPRWHGSFGHEPPLANNEGSWLEWGTLNSVNTMQRSDHQPDHPAGHHPVCPADREVDAADHRSPTGIASPGNTSRVAFVFDDDPADMENYYRRQARLNHSRNGGLQPTVQEEPFVTTVPSPLDNPGAPRVKSLIWAGQEIATFTDLVWPFVGILGYCIDVGSDVALMLEYLIAELYAWFALTMVFVALPTIAMTVLSIVLWMRNYKVLKEKVSPVQWTMRVTSCLFLSTPIMRLVDIFYYGWQSRNTTHDWYTRRMFYEKMIDEETECALVRLFETFLENAPQLVLQLYVITLVGTTKGLVLVIFQVAGLVISWLQMSVSLVSFHTVLRASLQPEKARMTWGGRICMFLWRMFTIASRVVSLALFASHFHFYVFVFIGGHFLIMFIWIINQESSYCQLRQKSTNGTVVIHDGQVSEFFFRVVAAAVHVFCFINLLEGPTRLRYGFYYAVMFIENITMAVLWYTFGGTVTETTWYHGPALAIVIGGFLIGLIFQVVYYMWFHPNNHNAAYSDRKIPWCRSCSEMSLIHNVNYKDEDFDDEEEEEVYVVKRGTHIEPMSRPPTGASNRELQPGYSGQIYHDDYREMMNYEPVHYPSNNGLGHAPMVQRPKSYLRMSRSTSSNAPTPPQSVQLPPHHPLNNRRFSCPEDTPLPPSISRQRKNSAPREQGSSPREQDSAPHEQGSAPHEQGSAPQRGASVPQRQDNVPQGKSATPPKQNVSPQRQNHTPQRQNNTPMRQNTAPQRQNNLPQGQNKQPEGKSYLAAGRGRGSARGPQWGQAAQQRQPSVGPTSSPDNTNNNTSFNVSKSTTV